jgi:hypothetical protein
MLVALLAAAVVTAMFGVTVFGAEQAVLYYDEAGNAININGLYYNSEGYPMYNAGYYYLDADDILFMLAAS